MSCRPLITGAIAYKTAPQSAYMGYKSKGITPKDSVGRRLEPMLAKTEPTSWSRTRNKQSHKRFLWRRLRDNSRYFPSLTCT